MLASFIRQKTLPVELVTMAVGKANPPDSAKNQRIETATQEQRIQTEQQKKLAEDQRAAPEMSRAQADNPYREAVQLSPQQFIQLETIKMQCSLMSAASTARPPALSFKTAPHRCTSSISEAG